MDFESVYNKQNSSSSSTKRELLRPGDLIRVRDKTMSNSANCCSSESESEPESSSRYRKRGWRLLKKKASLPNGFLHSHRTTTAPSSTTTVAAAAAPVASDRAVDDSDTDSSRNSSKDLPTWNSHETATKTLDMPEQDAEYFPIWNQKSPAVSKSVYETLYPAADNSEPPPPPLPPRTFPPRHRPLERTRAVLQLTPLHHSRRPPEVLRKNKPGVSGNGAGPVVPPRPKKIINPEDAFSFEIVDTDELSATSSLDRDSIELLDRPGELSVKPWGVGVLSEVVTWKEGEGLTRVAAVGTSAPLATPEQECSLVEDGSSSCDNVIDSNEDSSSSIVVETVNNDKLCSQKNLKNNNRVCKKFTVNRCKAGGQHSSSFSSQCANNNNNSNINNINHHNSGASVPSVSVNEVCVLRSSDVCDGNECYVDNDERTLSQSEDDQQSQQQQLSVPEHQTLSAALSPLSPSLSTTPTSDSGVALTSSNTSEQNHLVLSTQSSTSSDSLVSGNETATAESASSSIEYVSGRPRSVTGNEIQTPVVRGHKPLSRQVSHPPDNCVFMRPQNRLLNRVAAITSPTSSSSPLPQCPPTPTHHARPVRASFQSPILPRHSTLLREFNAAAASMPRPPLSSSSALDASTEDHIGGGFSLEQFRDSVQHQTRRSSNPEAVLATDIVSESVASVNLVGPVQQNGAAASQQACSILPLRHITSTRLPSIPERTVKGQRLEIGADDEPLPPCKFLNFNYFSVQLMTYFVNLYL